jgi:hypothetical protein
MDTDYIRRGVDGSRLLVEFDAWREYETHNIFPLYLGDYWGPRFRAIADAGIKNIGVRFNWNSGRFHIGDKNRPYANWVNLYVFSRFARDPYADANAILMDFCRKHFPEGPQAAFDMYKGTFEFIMDIYYNNGELFLHHGGLKRRRGTPVSLDQVTRAYNKMKRLIDNIPDTNQYKADLQKDALVISSLGKIAADHKDAEDIAKNWRRLDRDSYDELDAQAASKWR